MKLEMIQELCGINEDICRPITDCTKNTFKIKMFIKKLLDISRIESGKSHFHQMRWLSII